MVNMPPWFAPPIYDSAKYAFFSICVLAVITNVISRFSSKKLFFSFLFTIVLTAVIIPNIYINGALYLGRHEADISTWHLLPMFTAIHQAQSVLFIGLIAGIICISIWLVRKLLNAT